MRVVVFMYGDEKKGLDMLCTYIPSTCINKKRNKNVPFFPLPTESN